ncbi:MAG TPA: hypothetical protein PLL35_01550 [Candidatus Cloacimonas sp.]|nr:hypothetical protein [Candidatus Cloacimonas sp.]
MPNSDSANAVRHTFFQRSVKDCDIIGKSEFANPLKDFYIIGKSEFANPFFAYPDFF